MTFLRKNNKGSALILVLVLMTVLAAVGLSLLTIARIGSLRGSAVSKDAYTENASDYLIELIGREIADDCLDTTEPYDYPGTNDPWLSPIEPYYTGTDLDGNANNGIIEYDDETGANLVFWRQISKPSFADFGTASPYDFAVDVSGTETTIPDYQEYYKFISGKNENDDIADSEVVGLPADADGDGIADARWFIVPGMQSPEGNSFFAAVRIIDNSGMINVNTAYYNDIDEGSDTYLNSGESPLCVNLGSLLNTDEGDDIDTFHLSRCDALMMSNAGWFDYTENAAIRVQNPLKSGDEYYNLYGIDDEFELRHRFCINSSTTSRLEYNLSATIGSKDGDPTNDDYWGDMSVSYSEDTRSNDVDKLESWYAGILGGGKVQGETINPERRHLLTTYSRSRQITPSLQAKMFCDTISGQSGIADNEFVDIRDSVSDALSSQAHEEFGASYSADLLANQFALNLLEWQDSGSTSEIEEIDNVLYLPYDGVDQLADITLHCSGVGIYDYQTPTPQLIAKGVATGTYYALEMYIKGGASVATADDYTIRVLRGGVVIAEINLSDVVDTIPADGFIVLTNLVDKNQAKAVFKQSINEYYYFDGLEFAYDDKICVYKKDMRNAGEYLAVDYAEVKINTAALVSDTPQLQQKQGQLGSDTGLLLPDSFGSVSSNFNALGSLSLDVLQQIDIQLEPSNEPFVCPLQVVMAPAVCNYTDQNNLESFQTFAGAVETHKCRVSGELGPGTTDQSVIDSKGFGRFDIADSRYASLVDVFTTMTTLYDSPAYYATASAYDGIDNDGIRITTDDLLDDNIDNNGDGAKDNSAEELARYRETAVDGLININTAPKTVLMTLPWIDEKLANAIIAYRDLTGVGVGQGDEPNYSATGSASRRDDRATDAGFSSVYELINVTNDQGLDDYDMQKFAKDGEDIADNADYPHIDLTDDTLKDDLEERNIIVERLSNLTTTRSDVFTAYVLIREGVNGPQKRKVCIIDRSGVWSDSDTPVIITNIIKD